MKKIFFAGMFITVIAAIIFIYGGENNFLVRGVREVFAPVMSRASEIQYNVKLSLLSAEELQKENEVLKKEITSRKDIYRYKQEVDRLESLLGLKNLLEEHTKTVAAKVISCKKADAIVINKGKNNGIKEGDAVVSTGGVVGRIADLGENYAVVSTILSPQSAVSVKNVRTGKPSVTEGDNALLDTGLCMMSFIEGPESVNAGDRLETSGGVVFPEGFMVGTVKEVGYDNSVTYATVSPAVDISQLYEVLVICR